jgi:hypothetical protein
VHVTDLITGWTPMALIRDVLRVVRLPLLRNPRHVLSKCVVNLIVSWGDYDTNKRCTILDMCPYLMLLMSILVASYILELARI